MLGLELLRDPNVEKHSLSQAVVTVLLCVECF